jgi:hypothetical protein
LIIKTLYIFQSLVKRFKKIYELKIVLGFVVVANFFLSHSQNDKMIHPENIGKAKAETAGRISAIPHLNFFVILSATNESVF